MVKGWSGDGMGWYEMVLDGMGRYGMVWVVIGWYRIVMKVYFKKPE